MQPSNNALQRTAHGCVHVGHGAPPLNAVLGGRVGLVNAPR
jgi:hypothetical protein